MVASESVPFSKTGGLADVVGALPGAVAALGWDVTVVLPRYRGTAEGVLRERAVLQIGGYHADVGFFEAPLGPNARVVFVDEPALYDREALYGTVSGDYADNARRFGVLCRAALEYAAGRGVRPDVVHAHDWQAGLVPVYLKTFFAAHPVMRGTPSVFTIHNMAYQGLFEPEWLPRLDLPWSLFGLEQLEFWGRISLLKGGINFSEAITTVSPTYAREIQTREWGFGFDGIMRSRSADLVGVLNGIDADQWDPARDPFLPRPFDAHDVSGKKAAKAAVLERYGLAHDEAAMARPLFAMISRMVDQKGLDIIAALGEELARLDATFVVLGTGEERYQNFWRGMAVRHPDRIGVRIGFDEGLAHLIEGGADIFMMPSRFEPCGLNQMYSLRYGTLPLVRDVGGLADTVVGYAPGRTDATGFVIGEHTPAALLAALRQARALFDRAAEWRAMQARGMAIDHSWDRSAREYVKIYERAITKGDANGSRERTDIHGR